LSGLLPRRRTPAKIVALAMDDFSCDFRQKTSGKNWENKPKTASLHARLNDH